MTARGSFLVCVEKGFFSSEWRLAGTATLLCCHSLAGQMEQSGLRMDELGVALSCTEVVRSMMVPPGAVGKIEGLAEYEVKGLFPKGVEVATAQAVMSADERNIRVLVAAVEKDKIRAEGMDEPDAILTESLAVYQVLRTAGSLSGRTAFIYSGEDLAAVGYAEDGELKFLRSMLLSDTQDIVGECTRIVEHVLKKYAAQSVTRVLLAGKDGMLLDGIKSRFPELKYERFTHPQIPSPEFLPALGVALSLLPDGLDLNFVSKAERRQRRGERTKLSRIAVAVLPAILIALAANAVNLFMELKGKAATEAIAKTGSEITAMEKDAAALKTLYGSNERMVAMVRESESALGGGLRWSKYTAALSRMVPGEVTLESVSTMGNTTPESAKPAPRGRVYSGLAPSSDTSSAASSGVGRSLNIRGYAGDFGPINRFIENLENSKMFSNVKPMFEIEGGKNGMEQTVPGRVHFHVEVSITPTAGPDASEGV